RRHDRGACHGAELSRPRVPPRWCAQQRGFAMKRGKTPKRKAAARKPVKAGRTMLRRQGQAERDAINARAKAFKRPKRGKPKAPRGRRLPWGVPPRAPEPRAPIAELSARPTRLPSEIIVGKRHRKDLGDLDEMAHLIEQAADAAGTPDVGANGLLH